jgi:autotransporter-associated beta strand protein
MLYDQSTEITGGTLQMGSPTALGRYPLSYNNYGGSLSFGTLSAATIGGLTGGQNLALTSANSAPVALTILNAYGGVPPLSYSGALSGNGSLTVSGYSVWVLTGSNSYTGGTAITPNLPNGDGPCALVTKTTAALPGWNVPGQVVVNNGGILGVNAGGTGEWTAANIQTLLGSATFADGAGLAIDTTDAPGGNFNCTTAIGGNINVSQIGTGTLTLSAANTYSGVTAVGGVYGGGTIRLANPNALQNSTLDYSNGTLSFGTLTNATLGGLQSQSVDYIPRNLALTNDSGQPVALSVGNNNQSTVYASTFDGSSADCISGLGSLTKVGTGTLTLTGTNTYFGGTTVNAGTLTLAAPSALPGYNALGTVLVNSGGTLGVKAGYAGEWAAADITTLLANATFNPGSSLGIDTGALSSFVYGGNISGNVGFSVFDDSYVVLSGTNSYAGDTVVNQGTLVLTGSNSGAGATIVNGAGTLQVKSAAALPGYNTSGMVQVVGGELVVNAGGTGEWTAANIATLLANATFAAPPGTNYGYAATFGFDTGDAVGGSFTYGSPIGGPISLIKNGAGVLVLSAANTFSGPTLINNGTLQLNNPNALQNSTLDYGSTYGGSGGTLNFGTVTAATLGGLTGVQNLSLTNAASTAVALTVGGNNQGGSYSGAMSGSGSLTKIGTGMLTLSGTNTYTGATTVGAGTLEAMMPASLPGYSATGLVSVNSGGTLAVNVNSWTAANIDTLLANATFSPGSVLGIDTGTYGGGINPIPIETGTPGSAAGKTAGPMLGSADTTSFTYPSAIAGNFGLTTLGPGTVTLSGANSYTGLTTVTGGSLVLGPLAQNPVLTLGGADVQTGSLVFQYSGTSPAPTIESILAASYQHNFAAGSAQIFSSTALANGWTLGWSDDGSSEVTIMVTLPGDANLDGTVDVNDLTVVLTNFGKTGMVWSQGDFNYDGTVDVNDLTAVLANFGQFPYLPVYPVYPLSVPEPSGLLLCCIAAICLLGYLQRRRR